ncbi:MAG: FAD-binding oxidoreductase [Nanoarchaeota archaeon]
MKTNITRIISADFVTHDVKRFVVEKPKDYKFIPGQAVDLSINLEDYKEKKRPFTFTSLNEHVNLEFTIKTYKERNGLTAKMIDLKEGDEFIISEPFGAIAYKGKGVFIAGGAGVTPFIAILRQLKNNNKLNGNTLIFSNKTEKDIILKKEFDEFSKLGLNVIYTLTREKNVKYENKRIDANFLRDKIKNFNQHFYICGPLRFVGEIQYILQKLGANSEKIVLES